MKRFAILCFLAALGGLAIGVGAAEPPSGDPEGDFEFEPIGPTLLSPGAFDVIDEIIVFDDGAADGKPLNIERICVAKTAGSTLQDQDIVEIRLYRENGSDDGFQGFGEDADDLLGLVLNPELKVKEGDLDLEEDVCQGVQFGVENQLLLSVEDGGEEALYIVVSLATSAQRGDTLRLFVIMFAADSLIGSSFDHTSSGFISGASLQRESVNQLSVLGPLPDNDFGVFVIDETKSVEANAGATVVVQQFALEKRDLELSARIDRITVFAEAFRDDNFAPGVLRGIAKLRLYRESGATGPGWQPGDQLLAEIVKPFINPRPPVGPCRPEDVPCNLNPPDIRTYATFGAQRRALIQLPVDTTAQRLYVVAELSSDFRDEDMIRFGVEVTAACTGTNNTCNEEDLGVVPPKAVFANGFLTVRVDPPVLTVGDVGLASAAKVRVRVENVASPGLGTLSGVFSYDPEVVRVKLDVRGNPRVRALGPYFVDSFELVDDGEWEFVLALKLGRKPLIGAGDILEIEVEAVETAEVGAESPLVVEIEPEQALDVYANPMADFDTREGTARIKITLGDLNGDGKINRRDIRLLSRFLAGRMAFSLMQLRAADIAPPFCFIEVDVNLEDAVIVFIDGEEIINPARIILGDLPEIPGNDPDGDEEDNPCIDLEDLRDLKRASVGLIMLSNRLTALGVGLQLSVSSTVLGTVRPLEFRAQGTNVAELQLTVFSLAGGRLFERRVEGNRLVFTGLNDAGEPLANGVYLYRVMVRSKDGQVLRTQLGKFVVLR